MLPSCRADLKLGKLASCALQSRLFEASTRQRSLLARAEGSELQAKKNRDVATKNGKSEITSAKPTSWQKSMNKFLRNGSNKIKPSCNEEDRRQKRQDEKTDAGLALLLVAFTLLLYFREFSNIYQAWKLRNLAGIDPNLLEAFLRDAPFLTPEDLQSLGKGEKPAIQGTKDTQELYQSLGEDSDLMVFSGSANTQLAREVCAHLNMSLGRMKINRYADGEVALDVLDDIRSRDVYVFQSVPNASSGEDLHSAIFELFLSVSALKRSSAERITAVLPYMAYSRQESLDPKFPKPLAVADMCKILFELGADRLIFLDHHAPRAAAFCPENIPVTNLLPQRLAIHYLLKKNLERPVVVATDNDGGERAKTFWTALKQHDESAGMGSALWSRTTKGRHSDPDNLAENTRQSFVGDVTGRDCIVVDDLIDSAIRVSETVRMCKERGARRVYVYATHGVLSKGSVERLENCDAEEILMTNSIELPPKAYFTKFRIINVSKMIAALIARLHAETSVPITDDITRKFSSTPL